MSSITTRHMKLNCMYMMNYWSEINTIVDCIYLQFADVLLYSSTVEDNYEYHLLLA